MHCLIQWVWRLAGRLSESREPCCSVASCASQQCQPSPRQTTPTPRPSSYETPLLSASLACVYTIDNLQRAGPVPAGRPHLQVRRRFRNTFHISDYSSAFRDLAAFTPTLLYYTYYGILAGCPFGTFKSTARINEKSLCVGMASMAFPSIDSVNMSGNLRCTIPVLDAGTLKSQRECHRGT